MDVDSPLFNFPYGYFILCMNIIAASFVVILVKPVLLYSRMEKIINDALPNNPLSLQRSNVSVVEHFLGYPFIQLCTQAFMDKFCMVKQTRTSFVYLKRWNDVVIISENLSAAVAHNGSQLHHLSKQSISRHGFWKSWAAKDWSFVIFLYLILSFAVKGTCSSQQPFFFK